MQTKFICCDVCKEDLAKKDQHWSECGGPIKIGLKAHPAIQSDIDFDHLCDGCAKAIQTAVFEVVEKRKRAVSFIRTVI